MSNTGEPSSKGQKQRAIHSLARVLPRSGRNTVSGIGEEQCQDSTGKQVSTTSKRHPSSDWRTGSWRGKASAVAGLTHTLGAVASTAAATVQDQISAIQTPAPVAKTLRSRKSLPSIGAPTCVTVSSDGAGSSKSPTINTDVLDEKTVTHPSQTRRQSISPVIEQSAGGHGDGNMGINNTNAERPAPAPGWGGWWNRPTGASSAATERSTIAQQYQQLKGGRKISPKTTQALLDKTAIIAATEIPLPTITPLEMADLQSTIDSSLEQPIMQHKQERGSWFGLWAGAVEASTSDKPLPRTEPPRDPPQRSDRPVDGEVMGQNSTEHASKPRNIPTNSPRASGSWRIWSKGSSQPDPMRDDVTSAVVISDANAAVSAMSSQPKNSEREDDRAPKPVMAKRKLNDGPSSSPDKASALLERKNRRVDHSVTSTVHESPANPQHSNVPINGEPQASRPPVEVHGSISQTTGNSNAVQPPKFDSNATTADSLNLDLTTVSAANLKSHPNLVLPSLRETLQVEESPTYFQQLWHMFGGDSEATGSQLALLAAPPRIKHALAIGVHGLFPAPLLQKVLGPPKGTSVKFATGAATALEKWISAHGYECEVEKIALEGEGLISSRVNALWSLLINSLPKIREADCIMIACHSQGVPVAIMLMARLINLGCLNVSARLAICAMAGVNLGPIPSAFTKLPVFGPAAAELFSLSQPGSAVSNTHLTALRTCLAHHVRITYTASLDDQLVSLESALFATVSHPYIYRSVFIDGRVHTPDSFLGRLVALVVKLRNLGVSDHGLIRELSGPVAGSLYSSDGHSRVYEEEAVYDAALDFALSTTVLPGTSEELGQMLKVKAAEESTTAAAAAANPYFLPWAMRGVLEEKVVKEGKLREEMQEVVRLFEEWKPMTKALKDVRFRLEAVRGSFEAL